MAKLQTGDMAPDFETVDDAGNPVKLSDYRGRRVVLYFYPKDDTPGCTTQACNFRDSYADIEARNAVVLGVSPDDAESHEKFKNKFSLPFPLLMDEDHAIAEDYGVWGEKSMYGKKYMGVTRSHFVIDETGAIIDAKYNVKADMSTAQALEALTA
jgi:thioredoxin-dependent peroxiredoxin